MEERLTRNRSLDRDQEVELMVSVASLGGKVAEVDHRGRKKDFAEVREEETMTISGVEVAGLWLG
jgi:hypothetical protein